MNWCTNQTFPKIEIDLNFVIFPSPLFFLIVRMSPRPGPRRPTKSQQRQLPIEGDLAVRRGGASRARAATLPIIVDKSEYFNETF